MRCRIGSRREDTYVVDRPSAAAPADPGNVGAAQSGKVHFFPGILVSSNDDARFIAIDEQEWLLDRLLLEQPASECFVSCSFQDHRSIDDPVAGAYQSSNERLK
jgi:hypothetical protein